MKFSKMTFAGAALALLAALPAAADSYAEMFPELANDAEMADVNELLAGLDFRRGTVSLGEANASLDMGENYYFLGPVDAAYVLETLWENPPGAPVLGMVFPTDRTPLHDGWGMVLEYEAMGYVSDEDAVGYDYDALLTEMQADTASQNDWRLENGYESIELVGRAAALRPGGAQALLGAGAALRRQRAQHGELRDPRARPARGADHEHGGVDGPARRRARRRARPVDDGRL